MSVISTAATIVAHQGGWDEALLVAVPILFIFVMLYWAKRRAQAAQTAQAHTGTNEAHPDEQRPGETTTSRGSG